MEAARSGEDAQGRTNRAEALGARRLAGLSRREGRGAAGAAARRATGRRQRHQAAGLRQNRSDQRERQRGEQLDEPARRRHPAAGVRGDPRCVLRSGARSPRSPASGFHDQSPPAVAPFVSSTSQVLVRRSQRVALSSCCCDSSPASVRSVRYARLARGTRGCTALQRRSIIGRSFATRSLILSSSSDS